MFENRQVKYLTAKEELEFLRSVAVLNSPKYHLLALIMIDCGLRVSEAISLRLKDFNFQKPSLFVASKKKRGKNKNQIVELPMTRRIVEAAAKYWEYLKSKPNPDEYIFQGGNATEGKTVHRCTVYKKFAQLGVNPHKLRHTCATKLIENGTPLLVVKDLLRHSDSRITEVYIHTSEERKRAAINSLQKTSMYERVKLRLFPQKSVFVLPVAVGDKFHIGREKELTKLLELRDKKVNTLLLGERGTGKSHILDNFQGDKLLRIDDLSEFRKTLANLCLHLGKGEKETLIDMMNIDLEVVTKTSPKRIIENCLMKICEKHEYTIIIDDATKITPSVIPCLEMLAKHFHMVVAARSVPIAHASWLSSFQKIEINGLNRAESHELIKLSSQDYKEKIEDLDIYKNHIYESSNGNPQAIVEMVQRFRVEKFVRVDDIQTIQNSSGKKRRSFLPFLLIGIACFAISKFIIKEQSPEDTIAGQMIAGIIMVVLMLSRFGLNSIKRKFV